MSRMFPLGSAVVGGGVARGTGDGALGKPMTRIGGHPSGLPFRCHDVYIVGLPLPLFAWQSSPPCHFCQSSLKVPHYRYS